MQERNKAINKGRHWKEGKKDRKNEMKIERGKTEGKKKSKNVCHT